MAAAAVAIFALGWGAGVGVSYLKGRIFPSSFSASSPFPAAPSETSADRPSSEGWGESASPVREPTTPSPHQVGLAELSVVAWAPDGTLQWELRAESVEGSQSGEDAVLRGVEGVLYTVEGPVRVRAQRGEVNGRRQRVHLQGQVAVQVPFPGSAGSARTAAVDNPAVPDEVGSAVSEIELRAAELEHDQRSGLLVARGTAEEPVVAHQGRWTLQAVGMEYRQSPGVLLARGAARWEWSGKEPWALAAEEIEVDLSGRCAKAEGGVVLAARDLAVKADRATYTEADEKLVLSGEVAASSSQYSLVAREITVFLRDKRLVARGEVRIRSVRPDEG